MYDPSGGTSVLIPSSQITTGSLYGNNYLEFDVTGFSEFWIHTGNFVLPLQLLSFTAQKCNNNQVCLNWKTTNEQNVSHFEIEKSIDGRSFISIGTKAAFNQAVNNYSFTDNTNGTDTKSYYRIRLVDADSRASYSSIVWISFDENGLNIYPKSFQNDFIIQNNQGHILSLSLFAPDGRLLQTQTIKPGTNTIEVKNNIKGILFYRLLHGSDLLQSGKLWKE